MTGFTAPHNDDEEGSAPTRERSDARVSIASLKAAIARKDVYLIGAPADELELLVKAVEAAREAQDALADTRPISYIDRNNRVARALHKGLVRFDFGGDSNG